jgi:hypothetical protein
MGTIKFGFRRSQVIKKGILPWALRNLAFEEVKLQIRERLI